MTPTALPLASRHRNNRPIRTLLGALACALLSAPVFAQQTYVPPPLPNKEVDPFGLEVKTGRYGAESPEIVAVGAGDSRLAMSFATADGFDFEHNYQGQISFYPNEYAVVVEFGRTSERFYQAARHESTDAEVIYQPQVATGSLLRRTFDGSSYQYFFIMKDGAQVEYKANSNRSMQSYVSKVIYPTGYEVYIEDYSIRNNMGYQLKRSYNSALYESSYLAVNNAVDFCSDSSQTACGVSSPLIRNGKVAAVTSGYALTNPAGEVTVYKYQRMAVLTEVNGVYWYIIAPVAIDFPGGGLNEVAITYNYAGPNQQLADDIRITNISRDGLSMAYAYERTPISSMGASPGYFLKTIATLNGIEQYEAYSVKPPVSSGSSPRVPRTLLTHTDALGNVTSFQSDKFGRAVGATLPGGSSTLHTFDGRNNYTNSKMGGSGAPDLVTTRVFPDSCSIATQATCNNPSSITDPKGGVIDYSYNSRGQVLTVTLSAPTAGAVRPKTTYTYTMRTAYIKNSSGAAVAAGPAISMLTSTSACRTTQSCAGTTDEVLTQYNYGPTTGLNNLQLRGVGVTAANAQGQMETHWTCYKYNYFGEKIAETRAHAGLTSCS